MAKDLAKTKSKDEEKQKEKVEPKDQIGSSDTEDQAEKTIKPPKKKVPKIKDIEKDILKYIIGQDKQVRQVITAIYRNMFLKDIKANVLVIGKSGTGKTEIIRQVAQRLHVPITVEDATKYTQEGYYGADPQEMVFNLISSAKNDLKRAEKGIIVIDEIDKKANKYDFGDVSGISVLKSLLKIIEGTAIKVPLDPDDPFDSETVDFDTSGICIILLGAFEGLDKIKEKRLNTKALGFSKDSKKDIVVSEERTLKKDLTEYGFPEEFVGRIDTIIEMNNLTKEDLKLILTKSKLSIFRRYENQFKKKGIILQYPEEIFEKIAEKSLTLDTGARELSNTVNYIFENILYDVLANPKKFSLCKMDLEIVDDNTKYEMS